MRAVLPLGDNQPPPLYPYVHQRTHSDSRSPSPSLPTPLTLPTPQPAHWPHHQTRAPPPQTWPPWPRPLRARAGGAGGACCAPSCARAPLSQSCWAAWSCSARRRTGAGVSAVTIISITNAYPYILGMPFDSSRYMRPGPTLAELLGKQSCWAAWLCCARRRTGAGVSAVVQTTGRGECRGEMARVSAVVQTSAAS